MSNSRIIDLSGRKYGRLIVLYIDGKTSYDGKLKWRCKCDCGREITTVGSRLKRNITRSCGCLNQDKEIRLSRGLKGDKNPNFLHGLRKTPEYKTWQNMLNRCRNEKSPDYKYYGGRGIVVCERWRSFKHFLEDMGKKPHPTYSIDRINNNGNYEPSNCRWATKKEQSINTRIYKGPEHNKERKKEYMKKYHKEWYSKNKAYKDAQNKAYRLKKREEKKADEQLI